MQGSEEQMCAFLDALRAAYGEEAVEGATGLSYGEIRMALEASRYVDGLVKRVEGKGFVLLRSPSVFFLLLPPSSSFVLLLSPLFSFILLRAPSFSSFILPPPSFSFILRLSPSFSSSFVLLRSPSLLGTPLSRFTMVAMRIAWAAILI